MLKGNRPISLLVFLLKSAWITLIISFPIFVIYYDFGGIKTWWQENPNSWLWFLLPGLIIVVLRLISVGKKFFRKK
jgi:hypothetical protein